MRHLAGFGLAVALAAAVFFGAAWGYARLLGLTAANAAQAPLSANTLPANGGSLLHDSTALFAFAALAGVGLLAGICAAVSRISPLAAGLPGLALIAWTVLYVLNTGRGVRYIPLKAHAFGLGFEGMLTSGVLAAVGFALIVPLFIPSRWRGRVPPAPFVPEQDTAPAAGTQPLSSDWAETAPIPQTPPGDFWR